MASSPHPHPLWANIASHLTEREVDGLIRAYAWPTLAALFSSYTGIGFALWGAFFGAVAGAVGGMVVGSALTGSANDAAAGAVSATGWIDLFGGAAIGAVTSFIGTLGAILTHPVALVGALLTGAAIGGMLTAVGHTLEPAVLRMSGYRRLSREEASQLVPLLREVSSAMRIPPALVPRLVIADNPLPEASARLRSITVTTGWLDGYPAADERIAILAHELHHIRAMHSFGTLLVQRCALPTVLLYELGVWLARLGARGSSNTVTGFIGLIGWIFLWPSWVEINFVIVPLLMRAQRVAEYEADHAAARLGYADGMRRALLRGRDWEAGRTGWRQALAASHPPTALRLEALEPERYDASFQQPDLAPWLPRFIARAAVVLTILAVIAALVWQGFLAYEAAHPFGA